MYLNKFLLIKKIIDKLKVLVFQNHKFFREKIDFIRNRK